MILLSEKLVTLWFPVNVQGFVAAPAMYSSAPPPNTDQAREEIKMENTASSPTDTLLTSTAQVLKPASLHSFLFLCFIFHDLLQ